MVKEGVVILLGDSAGEVSFCQVVSFHVVGTP